MTNLFLVFLLKHNINFQYKMNYKQTQNGCFPFCIIFNGFYSFYFFFVNFKLFSFCWIQCTKTKKQKFIHNTTIFFSKKHKPLIVFFNSIFQQFQKSSCFRNRYQIVIKHLIIIQINFGQGLVCSGNDQKWFLMTVI